MRRKKLGLVHTSATLVPVFAQLCKEKLPNVDVFNIADDSLVKGIREAGSIQGAAFLSYFVAKDGDFEKNDKIPWAHLDIAGTADMDRDTPLFPKGPTGFGVRLLVRAIEAWK